MRRLFWAFLIIVGVLIVGSALRLLPYHTPAFWILWCVTALVFLTVILSVAVGDDNDKGEP